MTTETNQKTDQKVIDRVRKLLALAADGGATEAEASLAAERAREIMAAHGLSTATVEASGGTGERRSNEEFFGSAGQWWQPPLMKAICETCFVHCERTYRTDRQGRPLGSGYTLIGRESSVATARVLFEYLCQTVRRVTAESGLSAPKWFRRGMSERLCERILERHEEEMRKQKEAAQNQNSKPSNGTALVVVLEDYAATERELNLDLKNGNAPGTIRRERENREAEYRKFQDTRAALVADGVPPDVAYWMAQGFTRERADAMCRPSEEKSKPKSRAEEERERSRDRAYWERQERKEAKEREMRYRPDWQAGRRRGDEVGLDRQVDRETDRKKLS